MTYISGSDNYLANTFNQQKQTVKKLEIQLKEIYRRIRFFKPSVLRFFIFEVVSFWIIFSPIYYATQINFALSFLCGILTPLILYGIGLLANKIKYKLNYDSVQMSISGFKDDYNSCLTLIRCEPEYITQELDDDISNKGMYHDASRLSLHELDVFLDRLLLHYEGPPVKRKRPIAPQVELQPHQNTHRLGLKGGVQNKKSRPPRVADNAVLSTSHPFQVPINCENLQSATAGQ